MDLSTEGMMLLIAEMIALAVEEFHALSRHGVIVDGHLAPGMIRPGGGRLVRRVSNYIQAQHVRELIRFFAPGGPMEIWLRALHLNIDPDAVRDRLKRVKLKRTVRRRE